MNLESNELKAKISIDDINPNKRAEAFARGEEDFSFKELLDTESMSMAASAFYVEAPLMEFQNIGEIYQYDTKTIENIDAMFFLNIASQNGNLNIKMNDETSVIDATNYKTMEVSKTLGDLIMKASENNKALRLDFDNNVTVVLRVSQQGKIDATFVPQNKEVENYLKNNIDYLKVRFDEQAIAYSNISYKPYKQNSKRQGAKK